MLDVKLANSTVKCSDVGCFTSRQQCSRECILFRCWMFH